MKREKVGMVGVKEGLLIISLLVPAIGLAGSAAPWKINFKVSLEPGDTAGAGSAVPRLAPLHVPFSLPVSPGGSDFPVSGFHLSADSRQRPAGNEIANLPNSPFRAARAVSFKPRGRWGAAVLEFSLLHSYLTAKYWNRYRHWVEDWQWKPTWQDQKKRWFTTEAVRFDSNAFMVNSSHLFHGAINYNFSRTNRLSPLTSSLFTAAGSFLWEYFSEWREVFSVNDHFVTIAGGISLGEGLFQLGSYLRGRRGFHNRVLGFLFNPLQKLNTWLAGKSKEAPEAEYPEGYQDFRLFLGPMTEKSRPGAGSPSLFHAGFESRLIPVPGYGQPGSRKEKISRPLYSHTWARFDLGSSGSVERIEAGTRTIFAGHLRQSLRADASERLVGYTLIWGWSSGIDFYRDKNVAWYDSSLDTMSDPRFPRENPTAFTDKMVVVNLIGPEFRWSWFRPAWSAGLSIRGSPDFAMVNSLALNRYSALHDTSGIKTTLLSWGYYFAFGVTLAAEAWLDIAGIDLKARVAYHGFDSIEGLDRFQSLVHDDFNLVDTRLNWQVSAGFPIPRLPLRCGLVIEGNRRTGRIKGLEEKAGGIKIYYRIGLRI